MIFNVSVSDLINILLIASGIGVCGLCFLHITGARHLRKELRRYFQIFFLLIVFYISAHLVRQLMDGLAGAGVRTALYIVTFSEMIAAGFMAHMISLLVLAVTRPGKRIMQCCAVLLYAIFLVHILLLSVGQISTSVFYFDGFNSYHRAPLYLLSNLGPVLMLIVDAALLIVYRKNMTRLVKIGFWNYIIAPAVAIILQSASPDLQFIIFATVGASVIMFAAFVKDQNDKYEKQQIESSRIETELTMASSIQADMLPNIYPAFPDRPEFDIYASMNPAKEVGGDFYDFFLVDDDHLCIVMADVSGKGVPAALFMMASKIILANNAMMGKSPAEILTDTNAAICSNNREEMFVTVWLGILEISTGKLTAANAGHEYPAIKKADGQFELYKDNHGFVIGGMNGVKYKDYEIAFTPGSKLFLYTDGVPEATDSEGKMFGTEGMLAALNDIDNSASPVQVLNSVQTSVNVFVKQAEQFDDLTMLCLEYKKKDKGSDPNEIEIEADAENLQNVLDFIDSRLDIAECPMKSKMQLDLAVEEIFINIANYAYAPGKGKATVRVEVSENPVTVTITFVDRGVPYDPLKKADPDVTLSADEREIGGLGIFLTKKLMDDISYEYKNGQNVLTLKKTL